MWTAMGGEGGSWNVHFTNKADLVKLSTKGEGGQKSPKIDPHDLCMAPYYIEILKRDFTWHL